MNFKEESDKLFFWAETEAAFIENAEPEFHNRLKSLFREWALEMVGYGLPEYMAGSPEYHRQHLRREIRQRIEEATK